MRTGCRFASILAALMVVGCSGKRGGDPVFEAYQPTSRTPVRANVAPPAQPEPAQTVAAAPAAQENSPSGSSQPIVTPAEGITGKISSVNSNLRFVVVTFPVGQMAKPDQRLNVYRDGLKVGELLVTPPQREDSTVADITAGEARIGDEVRDR